MHVGPRVSHLQASLPVIFLHLMVGTLFQWWRLKAWVTEGGAYKSRFLYG